jgi:site-specific recombinase XerD
VRTVTPDNDEQISLGTRVYVVVQGRLSTLVPRDDRERGVIEVWRQSGIADGSVAAYLSSVRRYRAYLQACGYDEIGRLTYAAVMAYARSYVGPRSHRRGTEATRRAARSAIHAWWCALRVIGVSVPPWRSAPAPRRWPVLVDAYAEYRRAHRGVAVSTLARDQELASDFVQFMRRRGRSVARIRVADLDKFVDGLSARLARRTVAGLCSTLRCFLRFLQATGRIRRDLASCIVAPRFRADEQPPRALPWKTVQRILSVIGRDRRRGLRDYAMFLLMAIYGVGAGEVIGLRLDDIDWVAGVLRVRRPKTAVPITLPLLPAIAGALAAYLQRGRPPTTDARELFVTVGLPHCGLTSGALRYQARKYARRAGVVTAILGTHVFRHSHATRQIDIGAPAKIVSDILGHRRPSSTSIYVRLALQRLRTVGLPVPR